MTANPPLASEAPPPRLGPPDPIDRPAELSPPPDYRRLVVTASLLLALGAIGAFAIVSDRPDPQSQAAAVTLALQPPPVRQPEVPASPAKPEQSAALPSEPAAPAAAEAVESPAPAPLAARPVAAARAQPPRTVATDIAAAPKPRRRAARPPAVHLDDADAPPIDAGDLPPLDRTDPASARPALSALPPDAAEEPAPGAPISLLPPIMPAR